jgi:electron transport complex protein RnfE
VLPPGAFLVTGFLIAIKNAIDAANKRRTDAQKDAPVKGAKRIRTTGHIS